MLLATDHMHSTGFNLTGTEVAARNISIFSIRPHLAAVTHVAGCV